MFANNKWYLDQLTSRHFPPRTVYSPRFNGNACIYTCGQVDPSIVSSISPSARIVKVQTPADILARRETTLAVLLYTDDKPISNVVVNRLIKNNILIVVPAGDNTQSIDNSWFMNYPILAVGSCTQFGTVHESSNYGNVPIYALGKNTSESATVTAAAALHYIEYNVATSVSELLLHIISSSTKDVLAGVWPPYNKKIPHLHNKHLHNRLLFIPTQSDRCVWCTPSALRIDVMPWQTKVVLNSHSSVLRYEVNSLADLPHFVTLHDDVLHIHIDGVDDGIYQYWLDAVADDGYVETKCFSIIVKQSSDYLGVAKIMLNGEYIELCNATGSSSPNYS